MVSSESIFDCVLAIIRRTFSFQAANGGDSATEEPDVAMLLA